jgi:hypothetical protein
MYKGYVPFNDYDGQPLHYLDGSLFDAIKQIPYDELKQPFKVTLPHWSSTGDFVLHPNKAFVAKLTLVDAYSTSSGADMKMKDTATGTFYRITLNQFIEITQNPRVKKSINPVSQEIEFEAEWIFVKKGYTLKLELAS